MKITMSIFSRHTKFRELLSAYVDGQVSEREAVAMESHLASCAACQAELDSLRMTVSMLRALPRPSTARSFRLVAPPAPAPRMSPVWTWSLRAAAPAAAVLLLALVITDALGVGSPARADLRVSSSAEMTVAQEASQQDAAAPSGQEEIAASSLAEAIDAGEEAVGGEQEIARAMTLQGTPEAGSEDTEMTVAGGLAVDGTPEGEFVDGAITGKALVDDSEFAEPGVTAIEAGDDGGFPYLPLEIAAAALLIVLVAALAYRSGPRRWRPR
ncbi:MAG: hypothetical protein FJ317_01395 [SAR202 cluster bacterium]|nr:hypothetical protein [SAR202 cluster bacterium]